MVVEGKKVTIVKSFPVLYQAWECDADGFIVQDGNKKRLVLSSHGRFYFAKVSELRNKIEEYKQAVIESEAAIALLR